MHKLRKMKQAITTGSLFMLRCMVEVVVGADGNVPAVTTEKKSRNHSQSFSLCGKANEKTNAPPFHRQEISPFSFLFLCCSLLFLSIIIIPFCAQSDIIIRHTHHSAAI
jgi:hypothetical protein